MSKQKRMVYIYEENVDTYESLENKSEFINEALKAIRTKTKGPRTDNIEFIRSKLAAIDAKGR